MKLAQLLAALLVTAIPAWAQGPIVKFEEWSRFRGPNGAGVSDFEGLPDNLDPKVNLAWRTELPEGHSSPVLWRGRVYLTAKEGEGLWTYCLSAITGEVHWRQAAPRPRSVEVDGRNHPASPSPVVGAQGVFVFFPDYGMLGYAHDSQELWRMPLGPFDNVYGMGASPILVDDKVILACDQNLDSYLLAVSAATGEEIWRTPRPEAKSGHCTPILWALDNPGRLDRSADLILPGSFFLDGYNPTTGERLWWASGLSFEMKSVPVIWDDKIFINGYGSPMNQPGNQVEVPDFQTVLKGNDEDGDGAIGPKEMPPSRASNWFGFVDLDHDGRLDSRDWAYLEKALASQNGLLAFRPGGQGDVTDSAMAWSYRRAVPQLPSPLAYRGKLYILADSGGLVTVLDPATGEVLERARLESAVDSYYASPVAGGGRIYLASENGLVVTVDVEAGFSGAHVVDLGEKIYATPALGPGRVYLRSTQALYCFSGKD